MTKQPTQPVRRPMGLEHLSGMVADLRSMKKEMQAAMDRHESEHKARMGEAAAAIRSLKSLSKGDPGMPGKDGAELNHEKVVSDAADRVLARIPKPKDGKSVSKEEILKEVRLQIPSSDSIINSIKFRKAIETDPTRIISMVMDHIEKNPLKTKHISGLDQTISAIDNQTRKGYLHGGGVPSLTAGSNITLTRTSDGGFSVAADGGGTFYTDTVSGTINGSNKAFTVPNSISQALILFLAGMPYQPTIDFTTSGTTITFVTAPDSSLSGQPFYLIHI